MLKKLKDSFILILCFMGTSFLISTVVSSALTFYYNQTFVDPMINKESISIRIDTMLIPNEKLKDFLDKYDDNISILKIEEHSNGNYLYYKDMPPTNINKVKGYKIYEGRPFKAEDFNPDAFKTFVREDCDYVVKKDNKEYIMIKRDYYQVIGKFKTAFTHRGSYYIPLFTNTNSDSAIRGEYYVYAQNDTMKLINDLEQYLKKFDSDLKFSASEKKSEQDIIKESVLEGFDLVRMLLLTLFAILITTVGGISHWLGKQKQELSIRRLSGMPPRQLVFLLTRRFFFIITIGFILGVLLQWLFKLTDLKLFYVVSFDIRLLLIIYFCCCFLGLVTSLPHFIKISKFQIHKLLR